MLQGKKQLYSLVSNAEDIAEYSFCTTCFVDQGEGGAYKTHEICCKMMMKGELQTAVSALFIFSPECLLKDV